MKDLSRSYNQNESCKMSWLLKKVIHNEAMKEDPKEIYGWRVFMLACSVGVLFYPYENLVANGFRLVAEECSSAWILASLVVFSRCLSSKGA